MSVVPDYEATVNILAKSMMLILLFQIMDCQVFLTLG